MDVSEQDFDTAVIERSRTVPVLVDFWADWWSPCRQLGPVLERAVAARDGKVQLAKLDVDSNPTLTRAYGVQGIPAVKAFKDGEIVDEFVGVLPQAAIDRFLDKLVPSEAQELLQNGDEESLRRAVELEPPPGPKPSSPSPGCCMSAARTMPRSKLLERVPGSLAGPGPGGAHRSRARRANRI